MNDSKSKKSFKPPKYKKFAESCFSMYKSRGKFNFFCNKNC